MLAIHNDFICHRFAFTVANAFAKLSKCQQFTTCHNITSYKLKLQTLLQSYQNVSNSQQRNFRKAKPHGCKRFCKVIKMLAIHNLNISAHFIMCKRFCKVIKMLAIHNDETKDIEMIVAANAFAKLSKCQQFTTFALNNKSFVSLQTLLQSYQNVSNSQPFII